MNLFCWYATEADKGLEVKWCIERWAKPENYEFGYGTSLDPLMTDEEYNGIHCSSGVAFNPSGNIAKCVKVKRVM